MNLFVIAVALALTSAVGIACILLIINFLSPYAYGNLAIFLFYFSLFAVSVSSFTCLGLIFRYIFASKTYLRDFVINSVRQASIVGIISITIFFMLHKSYFNILNFILLVLIGIIFEILYYFYQKNNI